MNIWEVKILFEAELKNIYSLNEIRGIYEFVMIELTGLAKVGILTQQDRMLDNETTQQVYSILEKLKKHVPVQYIFGKAFFYGIELKVTPDVLIPRQETEELVDWIIKDVHSINKPFSILDIGTGSGCIALALKKNLSNCSVTSIDISEDALNVAKKNASSLNLDVEFIQADALQLTNIQSLKKRTFDIIVSNPPYIKQSDSTFVGKNVLEHEPHLALFVPDNNPFVFYEGIASYSSYLNKPVLYFEVHEGQGEGVVNMLKSKGFNQVTLRKDLNSKDRMVKSSSF